MHEWGDTLNDILMTVGAQAGVVALAIAVAALAGGQKLRMRWLVLALAVFVGYVLVQFYGDIVFQLPGLAGVRALFAASSWNWGGKIIAVCATLGVAVLVWASVKDSRVRMGFTLTQNPGSILPALAMAVAAVGASVALEISLHDGTELSADRMLYQAIVPGLDEEPMFRGLLLFLLTQGLGGNDRRLWHIGVGGLLTTLTFGLGHGMVVQNGTFVFVAFPVLVTGAIGLSLLWIRERTGSLVLPILVHNAVNVATGFF